MAIANARLSPARLSFLCQYLQGTVVLKHYISRYARKWHTQFFGYKRSCFLILTGGLLLDSVQLKSDRVRSWIQSSSQIGPSSLLKLDPVQLPPSNHQQFLENVGLGKRIEPENPKAWGLQTDSKLNGEL